MNELENAIERLDAIRQRLSLGAAEVTFKGDSVKSLHKDIKVVLDELEGRNW